MLAGAVFTFLGKILSQSERSEPVLTSGLQTIPPNKVWDALVVGAGPGGAMTAYELSRMGKQVLLVDRNCFPRWKVCGGTLSPGAGDLLSEAGLGDLLERSGADRLETLRLGGWGMRADLPLNGSMALSRSSLDSSLVEAAVAKGARFCGGARARLGRLEKDRRILEVSTENEQLEVSARIVIAADGLGSQTMAQAGVPGRTRSSAKRAVIGLGGVYQASVPDYESGIIHMAVGAEGYVGFVRVEDGSLNVAAALNPLALREAESPATLVDHLLRECGWPKLAGPPAKGWKGTPELTRRPQRPGAERLFAVGDAAGYLEPFTGEGVFGALAGARMLAPFAARVTNHWEPGLLDDWSRAHARLMGRAQRICRITSFVLARPFLTRALIRALMSHPQLARPMIRRVGAPIPSLG